MLPNLGYCRHKEWNGLGDKIVDLVGRGTPPKPDITSLFCKGHDLLIFVELVQPLPTNQYLPVRLAEVMNLLIRRRGTWLDKKDDVMLRLFLFDLHALFLFQLEDPPYQNLLLISSALLNMFDNDVDIFWISKGFFQYVAKFYGCVNVLVDTTLKNLEREDLELHR